MKKAFGYERQQIILEKLDEQNSITIKELTALLNVSEATLRSDLRKLEEKKLLMRTHGGAMAVDHNIPDTSFSARQSKNKSEKVKIARAAFKKIKNNQCIMLDASSTALELAILLKETNLRLTVVTSGLKVAIELTDLPNITVIILGGIVKQGSYSIEGTLCKEILNTIHVDHLFVSANGFSIESGFTDFNVYEVELKKLMVQASKEVTMLLDYSKIDKSSIAAFAQIQEINTFITDRSLPSKYVDFFKQNDVQLMIAES
ncbi:DeoR/GlpR family DNA-binding transcription regulator [Solibacillus sp. FSL W7-1436]|uniref:DeoR/GlpR family DNA-binding transcription regulator n=1 Tax=Solibacillus sp. FSL W7-1436 TaxID=2921705 RepID=UPI0030FB685F